RLATPPNNKKAKPTPARAEDTSRLRRRYRAPAHHLEGGGAAEAPGGHQGRLGRRVDPQEQGNGGDRMETPVWVGHEEGQLKDAALPTVTAASKLGEVHLIVAGSGVGAIAEAAAKIAGVGKVHVADDAAYAHGLAENVAPMIAGLMAGHDAFLVPSTTNRQKSGTDE